VRQAAPADEEAVQQLMRRARWVEAPFEIAEVGHYLEREPFLLAWEASPAPAPAGRGRKRLRGFLAAALSRAWAARLYAVVVSDLWSVASALHVLLPPCEEILRDQGAAYLVYLGATKWLTVPLEREWGFRLHTAVVGYEKVDWHIPARGNQKVSIRPVRREDIPALVEVDAAAFHPIWQNGPRAFARFQQTEPVFIVAEMQGQVVGYLFGRVNLDTQHAHLIRVAVHPTWQGRGIGVRLLAEGLDALREAGAEFVTLNTQQDNQRSQRLYRWFGFRRIGEEMLVWVKALPP